MSDMNLQQMVIDELHFEPSVDAGHIGVLATTKGVVTLTGYVSSYAQKERAEAAVWRVKGVKALAEELEVRLPNEKKLADDQIAQRAVSILEWNESVPPDGVQVKVADGWITLSGQVEWYFQRHAAEQAVRKLSGVTGVTNLICIVPRLESDDVHARIASALKRNAELEASKIRVEVLPGGRVSVDGEVDSWQELQAVMRAVWSTPGVSVFEDNIRIA